MSKENDESRSPQKPRIFISYSRRDSDAADSLATLCTRTGAETWLDRWELRPGESWAKQLDEAIDRCNVFLILVSHSEQLDSPLRSRELSAICERRWAARGDVRVIPIRLDESELPAFLSDLQALDGTTSAKLARCVQHIGDYPTARSASDPTSPTEEQREAVTKRFREVLEALFERTTSASGGNTPAPTSGPRKEPTDD